MRPEIPLYPHQKALVDRMVAEPDLDALLWWRMGMGKTRAACAVAHALLERKNVRRVVVIGPKSTISQWKHELVRTLGSKLADRVTKVECFQGYLDRASKGEIDLARTLLIVDEAHNFRHGHAKRSKAFVVAVRASSRAILLTGTPVYDNERDLVPLAAALDRTEEISVTSKDVDAALESLRGKVSWHRGGESMHGDQVQEHRVVLPMTREFQTWYELTEHEIVTNQFSGSIREALGSNKNYQAFLNGVRRICNGCDATVSPKTRWVVDRTIEWTQAGKKVLILSNFLGHGLDLIEKRLLSRGIRCYRIAGKDLAEKEMSIKRRTDMVNAFNQSSGGAVILVGPAGREGVHLPGGDEIVQFDPCWSESLTDQGTSRGCRPDETGVMSAKNVHYLTCAKVPAQSRGGGTVSELSADEHITNLAKTKAERCDAIAGRLRDMATERRPPLAPPSPDWTDEDDNDVEWVSTTKKSETLGAMEAEGARHVNRMRRQGYSEKAISDYIEAYAAAVRCNLGDTRAIRGA